MSTIGIQLPDDLSRYLQREMSRRGYKNASEFVRALLEADKHRTVSKEVEAMLLESTDGPFSEWTDDDVDGIRRTGDRMISRRKSR